MKTFDYINRITKRFRFRSMRVRGVRPRTLVDRQAEALTLSSRSLGEALRR